MKILFLGNRRKHRGSGPGYNGDMNITFMKEELARQHDVLFWGWGYQYNWKLDTTIYDIFDLYGKPDVIITLCVTDFNLMGLQHVKDILKVHIVGDYYPGMSNKEKARHDYLYESLGYDLLLSPNIVMQRFIEKEWPYKKSILWPWSVNINYFRDWGLNRDIDCCFMGAKPERVYGGGRKRLVSILKELPGNNWTTGVFFEDYVEKLNRSKIFVTNNSTLRYWSKKVLEAMACGCLLLTDWYEDYEIFGFVDKEHLVVYGDLFRLRQLIPYYLNNREGMESIAAAGQRYTQSHFNTEVMIEKLIEIIERNI